MPTGIISLCPREVVHEDEGAIALLRSRLGPDSAERVVAQAVEELAQAIAGFAEQVARRGFRTVDWQSRRLQKLALGLGLISLARVAGDLRTSQTDPTAFAAVSARLLRVAGAGAFAPLGTVDGMGRP